MITVDKLLLKITTHTTPTIEEYVPKRDAKVLRSLSSSINSPIFITENQSRLLLKILFQYENQFLTIESNIAQILNQPTWSKNFRIVDVTKRVYIKTLKDKEPAIFVEFSHSSSIRKTVQSLGRAV